MRAVRTQGSAFVAVVGLVAGLAVRPAAGQALRMPETQRSGMPGAMLGGVPSGAATRETITITITILDAITRALEHNLGVLTAEDDLARARGARLRELGGLLPNVSARIAETRQQTSLDAFGFGSIKSPSFGALPTIVGPFTVFDARVFLTQAIVDLGAINGARSEAHKAAAARYSVQSAQDLVVWVASNLYLQALASSARADAAHAQRRTAEAIYTQAVDLKQGGLVAGIDVIRAQVALNAETQRATVAVNDFEKAKLQLARVIGLPLGQAFILDATLPELPVPEMTVEAAVERALASRADYQAALERIRAAESARRAVIGDSLPTLHVNADFGEIGVSPSDSRGTFSVTGAVQIPIFQGGRTRGRLIEADADLRSRRSEAEDLKAQIYYDVRTALLDLQSTSEQLQVAARSRDLATQQLTQSRDRFTAGVANNIEIVQAQEAVAVANEQYISARYGYGLAKGALLRGIGSTAATLQQVFGGTR